MTARSVVFQGFLNGLDKGEGLNGKGVLEHAT